MLEQLIFYETYGEDVYSFEQILEAAPSQNTLIYGHLLPITEIH